MVRDILESVPTAKHFRISQKTCFLAIKKRLVHIFKVLKILNPILVNCFLTLFWPCTLALVVCSWHSEVIWSLSSTGCILFRYASLPVASSSLRSVVSPCLNSASTEQMQVQNFHCIIFWFQKCPIFYQIDCLFLSNLQN